MQTNEVQKPVLVLGRNGKTGRRVVERLRRRGRPVVAVSRSTTPRFDWNAPDTWGEALAGVGAVYITYQPDLAVPGAVAAVQNFISQALAANVRRLVLLSGRGEDEAQRAERVLQASDADWTIVRASWFAQNFSENFLIDGVRAGKVVLPALAAKEPFVDADDIADVAVAALMDGRHIGRLYEVTGPRLMSFAEAIAEIASARGRQIEFAEVPHADYELALRAGGLPDDLIWLIMYLFTTVLDGRNAHVSNGIEQALGRGPRDFREYAHDVAATQAWAA